MLSYSINIGGIQISVVFFLIFVTSLEAQSSIWNTIKREQNRVQQDQPERQLQEGGRRSNLGDESHNVRSHINDGISHHQNLNLNHNKSLNDHEVKNQNHPLNGPDNTPELVERDKQQARDRAVVNETHRVQYRSQIHAGPYRNQQVRRQYQGPNNRFREGDDSRVPFWNIAHMINSIEQVGPALSNGSNGIEVDISFDHRGFPIECYHGFPCDCGRHCHYREDFVKMIQYLSKISIPPADSNLQVILLDLKLSGLNETQKRFAGEALATILSDNLFEPYWHSRERTNRMQDQDIQYFRPPLRVIISINHVSDAILIKSFIGYLETNRYDFMRQFIGFDVGMNDDLSNITEMWDRELSGTIWNIWQGDGLTNCANLARGVSRLKDALQVRNNQGPFKKVYYWTVDILYQIRSMLRLGLDAVLTNQPDRVNQVLQEPEFRNKYRLATPYDDPFMQFWIQPSMWRMSFPTLEEARETFENIGKTGEKFIKTLPDGIAAAFKKVQSTITAKLT